MKVSFAASIFILLVAALIGIPNHQRILTLRESHGKLVATAAHLGFFIDSSAPDDTICVTKRTRENAEIDTKALAADFISFARDVEASQKNGEHPDEALQKRSIEIMESMTNLDAAQLKIVIAEFRAANDLGEEIRQSMIAVSIMTIASDQPQTALALIAESSDLFKNEGMGTHVVSSSLTKWAKNDPMAALDWVKKNSEKFPDLVNETVKIGMISGAAAQDPKLAFKLISEIGIKEASQAVSTIVSVAKTPEERSASLKALREHLATLPDDESRTELSKEAVSRFANDIGKESFEASTQWIANSNFTATELEGLASGLQHSAKNNESGKWIEWIGDQLPPDKAKNNIENLVRRWTRNDYQAAGEWLASAREGPTKNTAIRSYATTVSEYEPAIAVQWANTLPLGKDRKQTLRSIYQNWPKEDSAAREAFKKEHGIK